MNSRTSGRLALTLVAILGATCLFAADTADSAAGKKVNINQASAKEISNLPRIGAKAAERIVEYRKAHGSFARAEDLMEVKGIGEKLFTTLNPT
ncbi:MAG TPA: helix-hairpin-helix domain-containing protein [Thermoanaerobaculia bacterium]|nr:helix-hairpin-helix domain-containing protein [Thermoanaerobaculia bacterium]